MKRIVLILLVMIALLATGCKGSKIVTMEVPKIEKEYIVSTDTVRQYDSVYVFNDRYIDRDTVYLTKTSEKYRYLYKTRVDTLMRTDTITIVDEHKIIEQEKQIESLENVMSFYRLIGVMLIGVIACLVLLKLFK